MKQKSIQERTLDSFIAGIISFLISFAQSFLLVPLFLKFWGSEKYSIWISLYAFISLIRTIDLGHANYIGNEFNRLYYQNYEGAKKLLGSSIQIGFILGILELLIYVLILVLGLHDKLIGIDLKNYSVSGGIISLLVMWLLIGTTSGILVRIILPLGKYSRLVYFQILIRAIELMCMFYCVYHRQSINTLCYAISVSWIVYSVFVLIDIKRIAPAFYPWWQHGNLRHGLHNFYKSTVLTFNGFVEQLNTTGLILLISNYMAFTQVPVFTTIRTATNVFIQITSLILNPLVPDIIRYHATGENRKINTVINTNWFISGILVNIPFLLLIPFIEGLYAWWTKNRLPFNAILFYELALCVSIINFGRSYMTLLGGINDLRALSIITITRFSLMFSLCIYLVKVQGLEGIGVAVLLAEVVASGILPCYFSYRKLKEQSKIIFDTHTLTAISQTLILALYYYMHVVFPAFRQWTFWVCLLLLLFSSFLQWRHLDVDVKIRLRSLTTNYLTKFRK